MVLTKDLLLQVSNKGVKDSLIDELVLLFNQYFPIYKISNPLRVCAFLAQTSHESGGYLFFTELGNIKYFDKYEPGTKIGNRLGNIIPGDGYRYRARGIIGITGRDNYISYGRKIGEDLVNNPNLAKEPVIACKIACEFWNEHKLSPLADLKMIETITKRINGGLNGIEDRKARFNRLCNYLKC